tara:strand:+ start:854 stop:1138 length:285 start_codon:yes stop_codon:yes gene_type:complete
MYIDKEDKIVKMLLISPHEGDFTYKRPDSSTYVRQVRKNKDDTFYIPLKQLELELNLESTTKQFKPNLNAPHLNILDRYYGKGWKLVDQNLPPH